MDQREPGRTPPREGRPREPFATADPDALPPPGPRRFARLVPPAHVRRVAPRRLALAAAAVAVAGLLASAAVRWAVHYLHAQPAYQVDYRQVVLDPPPPAWYRGGAPAFLDRVWAGSAEPRTFSTLDARLDRLDLLFRRYCWVRKVLRVEIAGPNRLVVRLRYREPVAFAGNEGVETYVDAEGVILPRDDVDRAGAGPLVRLHNFPPPAEPRAGEVWARPDPRGGVARPDETLVAAAGLADFLKRHMGELAPLLPSRFHVFILPVECRRGTGLYVQIGRGPGGDKLMLFWDDPDTPDASVRDLSLTEKWGMVVEDLRRNPLGDNDKAIYRVFSPGGLAPSPAARGVPATGARPGRGPLR